MKRYLAAALIILSCALTGCMGEDWSLCADENCLLRYRYQDESGADAFTDNIRAVDLMLFDQSGHLAAQFNSTQADLALMRGVNIHLDAGEYYVVAWANLDTQTRPSVTTLTESKLDMEDGNGGLPLFYAPFVAPITRAGGREETEMEVYKITIPKKGTVERDLDFRKAHRSINVYIKGYEDEQGTPDPAMQVEITHLAYAYDFLLRVEPVRRTHTSNTEPKTTPAGTIPGVKVNTPYQEIEEEINIEITSPGGNLICPAINLKQYLVDSGQTLDALSLHEINILLTYENGKVTISIPDWGEEIVEQP